MANTQQWISRIDFLKFPYEAGRGNSRPAFFTIGQHPSDHLTNNLWEFRPSEFPIAFLITVGILQA